MLYVRLTFSRITSRFHECSSFTGSRPGFVFKMDSQGLGYYTDTHVKRPSTKQSLTKHASKKDGSMHARGPGQKHVHKNSRSGSRSRSRGRRRSRSRSRGRRRSRSRGRRRRHKNDRKKTKKRRSTSSESPTENGKATDGTDSTQKKVKQVTPAGVDPSQFDLNANSIAERVAELEQSLCKVMKKEKSTSMATSWIMECFSEQVLPMFVLLLYFIVGRNA